MCGDIPAMLNPKQRIVPPMKDQRGDADRRENRASVCTKHRPQVSVDGCGAGDAARVSSEPTEESLVRRTTRHLHATLFDRPPRLLDLIDRRLCERDRSSDGIVL